jgi:hypothetical protein
MKENPKHTDHHFTPLSEYKYTLEFLEPRKTYEELQKENNRLKLVLKKIYQAAQLHKNSIKLLDYINSIINVHLFR